MRGSRQADSLFAVNPVTGRTIIEVSLDDYMDFFHEWDNATFRKRDMHPELAEFLDLCSEEIPLRLKLEILFAVRFGAEDPAREQQIRGSYENYYKDQDRIEFRRLKAIYAQSAVLFLVAAGIILVHAVLRRLLAESLFADVAVEGTLIGGWVLMWEAFHMVFFEGRAPLRRNRELKRFLRAELNFRHGAGDGAEGGMDVGADSDAHADADANVDADANADASANANASAHADVESGFDGGRG